MTHCDVQGVRDALLRDATFDVELTEFSNAPHDFDNTIDPRGDRDGERGRAQARDRVRREGLRAELRWDARLSSVVVGLRAS
jgi:hypothetical protein